MKMACVSSKPNAKKEGVSKKEMTCFGLWDTDLFILVSCNLPSMCTYLGHQPRQWQHLLQSHGLEKISGARQILQYISNEGTVCVMSVLWNTCLIWWSGLVQNQKGNLLRPGLDCCLRYNFFSSSLAPDNYGGSESVIKNDSYRSYGTISCTVKTITSRSSLKSA